MSIGKTTNLIASLITYTNPQQITKLSLRGQTFTEETVKAVDVFIKKNMPRLSNLDLTDTIFEHQYSSNAEFLIGKLLDAISSVPLQTLNVTNSRWRCHKDPLALFSNENAVVMSGVKALTSLVDLTVGIPTMKYEGERYFFPEGLPTSLERITIVTNNDETFFHKYMPGLTRNKHIPKTIRRISLDGKLQKTYTLASINPILNIAQFTMEPNG